MAKSIMTSHTPSKSQFDFPSIHIITLNWNGKHDTIECLQSLQEIEYPNYGITVCDNGSSDGSVETIQQSFPHVTIIENGENLGFAEGNNSGIRAAIDAGVDFVFLVNNDTIVDTGILYAFVKAYKRIPNGGVYGAKIYHHSDKNKLWYAGGYWDADTLSFEEYGAGQIDQGQYDKLTETEWVVGCAMFIPTKIFREIGFLEHLFFLNNEEIDFCSRVKQAGYNCIYVPEAKIWHKISVSFGGEHSPMKEYFTARNRLLWAKRNASTWLTLRIHFKTVQNLAKRFIRPLFGFSLRTRPIAKNWLWKISDTYKDPINIAYILGIIDFWLGRFGNCPDKIRELTKQWVTKNKQ